MTPISCISVNLPIILITARMCVYRRERSHGSLIFNLYSIMLTSNESMFIKGSKVVRIFFLFYLHIFLHVAQCIYVRYLHQQSLSQI